jgi:uncharacterized protein YecT (DUF1311 family)
MRSIALAVFAIQIGLGHPARAESAADSSPPISDMLPLFGKNRCELIKDPADQLFCGDPELNGTLAKLNGAVQQRLDRLPNRPLAVEENAAWIRDRNSSCGILKNQNISSRDFKPVKACLLLETEERIEILADPNFDCLATATAAGGLICSDPILALARDDLNSRVLGLIAKLKQGDVRDAFAEYERWGRDRDRRCNLAGKENVPLQELSPSEACLNDYFTKKVSEVTAAKGDPKRIFGRHPLSSAPDADAVDLCVAQIHSANACGNFLAVSRIFQIDSKVSEQNATVTAAVEMIVLSPFTACSPVAANCTGTCWDLRSGQAKPSPGSRESLAVAYRLRVQKSFAFQKTDGGWRCNSAALQPVEVGVATRGP